MRVVLKSFFSVLYFSSSILCLPVCISFQSSLPSVLYRSDASNSPVAKMTLKITIRLLLVILFIIDQLHADKGCGQRIAERRSIGTIKRVATVRDSAAEITEVRRFSQL